MSKATVLPIPEIDRVTEAFPANALSWMPPYEEIPQEYKDGDTKWNQIANSWFFHGLPENVEFHPNEGVDAQKAFRAVNATLGSYAPKHEHKMAACAYMLSCWFKKVKHWKQP